MDHIICINQNSFPASNSQIGQELLQDALQGALQLQEGSDRFFFYLDSNGESLYDFNIAENYTYEKFCEDCDDVDMAVFLSEVEDKSPALDSLSDDQLEEMSSYSFYVKDRGVDRFPDVYALAWAVSGYLLSINTDHCWSQLEIHIARVDGSGVYIDEDLKLKNISKYNHGVNHFNQLHEIDIVQLLDPHLVTESLKLWFEKLSAENKTRVVDKLRLAYDKEFQGGEPLFKTLNNCDGLREIRFSAYSGGAIRILFKHIQDSRQILLVGFIKYSNSGGYEQAIVEANNSFSKLIS
ncbi:type II toxin-antitoxin system RelE/ParE family toxin [uncultured Acinetobacter sp.]|uniref:type II toxin-antitoxin system RelE/ParE family toxin n=1 Tax=uncultured Acinetobacter sp. TaxID=165433 RepID=UPI00258B6DF2|nr:type II toxin-antitoxin system RelE/ParE family toxin [uncultured Acinetobacter sp.]